MTQYFSQNHSFYGIKENVQRFQSDKADLYGYLYEKNGDVCATLFPKRGKKPVLHCRYGCENSRAKDVEAVLNGRIKHKEMVSQRRAENSKTTLKAGDILYTSWGWEQTNVDFFKVLEVCGKKKIKLVEIAQKSSEHESHGMACTVTADEENTIGQPFYKMASKSSVKISRSETAWLWDGKPKYKSWYA